MSLVDNVLVSWGILEHEDEIVPQINGWCAKHLGGQQFVNVAAHLEMYGGGKFMETVLLAAAFNYFHEDGFMQFLTTLSWREPQHVQMIIKRQDDDTFEIVNLPT